MTPFLTLAQGLQFSFPSFLMILFVVISVLMILVVLIQRPQGGGLSGAFGAAADGAGQTAFGAKTGDALTFATVAIFVMFLCAAIGLNFMLRPDTDVVEQPEVVSTDGAGAGAADNASGPSATTTGADGKDEPVKMKQVSPEELEAIRESFNNNLNPTTPEETPEEGTPEEATPENAPGENSEEPGTGGDDSTGG